MERSATSFQGLTQMAHDEHGGMGLFALPSLLRSVPDSNMSRPLLCDGMVLSGNCHCSLFQQPACCGCCLREARPGMDRNPLSSVTPGQDCSVGTPTILKILNNCSPSNEDCPINVEFPYPKLASQHPMYRFATRIRDKKKCRIKQPSHLIYLSCAWE